MSNTTPWTNLEITTKAAQLKTNLIKFKIPLTYVYVHYDPSTISTIQQRVLWLHKNVVYPTLGGTCDNETGTPYKAPHIYTSATSDLPPGQFVTFQVSASVINTMVTPVSTKEDVLKASTYTTLPTTDGLYIFIVQNLNVDGIPIPLFDTHSLTASDMISRYGFVSSTCLSDNSAYPIFNGGKTILHALGHMLGLPHTFHYNNCSPSFSDVLNTNFHNRVLSQVHDNVYTDQQYDNVYSLFEATSTAYPHGRYIGTNAQRISNQVDPKPFDVFANQELLTYACHPGDASRVEGVERLMDIAPDNIRKYFTLNNAVLMRQNLMNYDMNKHVADAKGLFNLTLEETNVTPPDTHCTNCPPPPPPNNKGNGPTIPIGSGSGQALSTPVILGISGGLLGFIVICYLLFRYWRSRKTKKVKKPKQEPEPEPAPVRPIRPLEEPENQYTGPIPTYDVSRITAMQDSFAPLPSSKSIPVSATRASVAPVAPVAPPSLSAAPTSTSEFDDWDDS
jgi:hypothetical protein